jgi:hypothetical protein
MIAPRSVVQLPAQVTPAVAATKEARPALTLPADPSVGTGISSQPPVIRVTIGRIEVRAVFPPAAAAPAAVKKTPSGALSLDDYLKQRSEGTR